MSIPLAAQIQQFQAPSVEKLLHRCETQWRIIMHEGIKGLTQTQRSIKVPIMHETEDMVKEVITVLTNKSLGYTYSYELLDKVADDNWTTGYLVFTW